MDDFVVNVRQIGQYPTVSLVGRADLLLMQAGGLAGPYVTITPGDLLASAFFNAGTLTTNGVVSAAEFSLPAQGSLTWGIGGPAPAPMGGMLSFSPAAGWDFVYAAPTGAASAMNVSPAGEVQLPFGTVKVARDPFEPFEVATANYVTNNTVASFNGRTGPVCLTSADVYAELCLEGPIATQPWVDARICESVPAFILQNPFVYTWNGRVGDVQLTLTDIETEFFRTPGSYPTAPSPPQGDASNRIATTGFVDETLDALVSELGQIGGPWAPINSPQFTGIPTAPTAPIGTSTGQIATTAFVLASVAESTTGVASFNGRTGNVNLTQGDIVAAQGWDNVNLTGVPVAPTAAPGTDNNQLATTAFVINTVGTIDVGVTTWNGRIGTVSMTATDVQNAGGALVVSPTFVGTPSAPTAAAGTNNSQLATTAFVAAAVAAGGGVVSFNGRQGAVTFQANDISAVGGALLAGPAFSGIPTAPTANPGTNTQQLATTAFVTAAVQVGTAGVSSFNTRTGAVTLNTTDITSAGGAPVNSPALTGTPTAPTAGVGTSNTQIATTAFVSAAITNIIGTGAVVSFNGRQGAVTLLSNDVSGAGGALLVSPTFTGVPAAPTATTGTSTTQIASTAFVNNQIAATVASGLLFQGSSPPASPTTQSLWWDTNSGQMFVYFNSAWVAVSGG